MLKTRRMLPAICINARRYSVQNCQCDTSCKECKRWIAPISIQDTLVCVQLLTPVLGTWKFKIHFDCTTKTKTPELNGRIHEEHHSATHTEGIEYVRASKQLDSPLQDFIVFHHLCGHALIELAAGFGQQSIPTNAH